ERSHSTEVRKERSETKKERIKGEEFVEKVLISSLWECNSEWKRFIFHFM
uniref:Uncharacterized protein n=1 Tax=Cucumis melo TaxID=3656 RepID=A0A9I9E2L2_CUCME